VPKDTHYLKYYLRYNMPPKKNTQTRKTPAKKAPAKKAPAKAAPAKKPAPVKRLPAKKAPAKKPAPKKAPIVKTPVKEEDSDSESEDDSEEDSSDSEEESSPPPKKAPVKKTPAKKPAAKKAPAKKGKASKKKASSDDNTKREDFSRPAIGKCANKALVILQKQGDIAKFEKTKDGKKKPFKFNVSSKSYDPIRELYNKMLAEIALKIGRVAVADEKKTVSPEHVMTAAKVEFDVPEDIFSDDTTFILPKAVISGTCCETLSLPPWGTSFGFRRMLFTLCSVCSSICLSRWLSSSCWPPNMASARLFKTSM